MGVSERAALRDAGGREEEAVAGAEVRRSYMSDIYFVSLCFEYYVA